MMITLNEISLIIAILSGIVGILAHIKLTRKMTEDQLESAVNLLYPDITTLIADFNSTHKEAEKPLKIKTYPNTNIPIRTLNRSIDKTEDKIVHTDVKL